MKILHVLAQLPAKLEVASILPMSLKASRMNRMLVFMAVILILLHHPYQLLGNTR